MIDILGITAKKLKTREYEAIFPEYYALEAIVENGHWHQRQNVLDHVIGVFAGLETILASTSFGSYLEETIGTKSRRELLVVATLLHDIAKVDTLVKKEDGAAGCPGHELIGAARVSQFSARFGLDAVAESYVERIVRYHGFISEILSLIISTGQKEKYLNLFFTTVGDVAIELTLLMHADLLGSDLMKSDNQGFDERIVVLQSMLSFEKYHPAVIQILDLLERAKVWHETFEHEPVRTSEEAANLRDGFSLNQGAKAIIIRAKYSEADKKFLMLVVPGDVRFDSDKVKKLFKAKSIRFATETEVSEITGGVLPGGVPPFGDLFGLEVIVDPTLLENEKIIFNAGDRSFSIAMRSQDYIQLSQATVAQIV